MEVIVCISCGSKKAQHPTEARHLYLGTQFRVFSRVARRLGTRWFILSAKHGLVEPTRVLAPYEQTLPQGGDLRWGESIKKSLERYRPWDRLIVLASERYLIGWADRLGAECPTRGLPIGKGMQAAIKLR